MPYQRKVTPEDDEYIRSHADMSERDIAAFLGLSQPTVHKRKHELGLDSSRAQDVTKAAIGRLGADFGETELEGLHHLKQLLEEMMADVAPTVFAKLAKEYRETMARISELEAPAESEEEDAPNSIDKAIADALSRL